MKRCFLAATATENMMMRSNSNNTATVYQLQMIKIVVFFLLKKKKFCIQCAKYIGRCRCDNNTQVLAQKWMGLPIKTSISVAVFHLTLRVALDVAAVAASVCSSHTVNAMRLTNNSFNRSGEKHKTHKING